MRILVRTSKWALWARRIAGFALPITAIPVALHWFGVMDSIAFEAVEVLAFGIAGLAFLVSLGALARLWISGDRGWLRALTGLLVSLICLAPFGYLALQAYRYPDTPDLSTDYANPPTLLVARIDGVADPYAVVAIEAAFPNARTRRYPLNVEQMFDIVESLIAERGWAVNARTVPVGILGSGQINAVATTLFGWRDEVVLRVRGDTAGTTVDMRSTAISSIHDFGANGSRIEAFMLALDTTVTQLMRDNPASVAPLEEGGEEAPAVEQE